MLLHWLLIAAIAIAVSWIVMIVLAKRLPPGLAKDLASVLPACVTTARRLRNRRILDRLAPATKSITTTTEVH